MVDSILMHYLAFTILYYIRVYGAQKCNEMQIGRRPEDIRRPVLLAAAQVVAATERGDNCVEI